MQKLVTMVKTQHETWRERQAAKPTLVKSSLPISSEQDEKKVQPVEQSFISDTQEEPSLSMYALSTRYI